MGEGLDGPAVLNRVVRVLCRGLSQATPAAVMQSLQNAVATSEVPFATYLVELGLLVGRVHRVEWGNVLRKCD